MHTLKVLSALLCYPDREIIDHLEEMAEVLKREALLPATTVNVLEHWMARMDRADLMDLQAEYVILFDRGRALSLHLFEHVHGESRARGQAMVDLMNLYQSHGFRLSAQELPDFIPLFLEYLSERPADEARELLRETAHVVSLLRARLEKRDTAYALVFEALECLGGKPEEAATIAKQVAAEPRDDTPEALDQVWEDEPVIFGPGAACSAGTGKVVQRVSLERPAFD